MTTTITRDDARQMVQELRCLEFMSAKNAASYFSRSIEWHPDWGSIFSLIREVREEYTKLLPLREAIQSAIKDGKVHRQWDCGGGWEWYVNIVTIGSLRIRVFEGNEVSIYKGQHDRPVMRL